VKNRHSRIFVCVVLFTALLSVAGLRRQQAQSPQQSIGGSLRRPLTDGTSGAGGFVITGSGDGTICRKMTGNEEQTFQFGQRREELHALVDKRLNTEQQQQGLKIILRGTSQLEQFPEAKQAFLRAAARWEAIIQSPITIVVDVDFGPTILGTPYPAANIIGLTSEQPLTTNIYSQLRTLMIVQALLNLNLQQVAVYNALPATAVPTDLGPTTNVMSEAAIFRAIGVINPVADPNGEMAQFGPPPIIGFNSAFTFDFDSSNGIDFDKVDFEAAALHEIGHALGFTSNVGNKELIPSSLLALTFWDFFRFRPGGLTQASFTNSSRIQTAGGEQIFFIGDNELALSTSPAQGVNGGDGQQASHWKDEDQTGQYIGVMDPTLSRGLSLTLTANDLTALGFFGYKINPNSTVTEVLSVDDNSREEALASNNAIVVNRFTPARYPSTLKTVRIQLPPPTDGSNPVGQQLRLVAFIDANRTGQPPANPTFIVDRTITIPSLASQRFIEVLIPTPPVINSGDLYVGIQSASASVLIAGDRNGRQQGRSFISTNNAASFQPLVNASNAPINFIERVLLENNFSSTPSAALASISPNALAPGSAEFTLYVQGSNFQSGSVVRWNGNDRATTFVTGTQLTAQVTAADVASAGSAKVTVFTPVSGESAGLNFTIGVNNPAPTIARVSPNIAAAGATSPVTLGIFGTNFTPQSVVRLNGENRPTTLVSSVQVNATIPASDLAAAGAKTITVLTPGPGGGTSNEATFTATGCSYALSVLSHTISSTGVTTGTTLTTASPCTWTAVSNVPWITLANPASGTGAGKFVVNYTVSENTGALRTGTLNVAGQTISVKSLGRATGVSAASFSDSHAPNSISAVFGTGLAKSTQVATTQPLPTVLDGTTVVVLDSSLTTRNAQLFFSSPNQINFLVPPGTAAGNAFVRVLVDGSFVADGLIKVNTVAPSLFSANASGSGVAAAVVLRVKADGTQIFEPLTRFDTALSRFVAMPIDFGAATDRIFLLLYGTGIRGRSALAAVSVKVGDVDAPVSYAGPQNDFAGLDQINAELPRGLIGRGDVNVVLIVDNRTANAVTVTIK